MRSEKESVKNKLTFSIKAKRNDSTDSNLINEPQDKNNLAKNIKIKKPQSLKYNNVNKYQNNKFIDRNNLNQNKIKHEDDVSDENKLKFNESKP